jgi:hypothetical protein
MAGPPGDGKGQAIDEGLRNWVMVALTLVFVGLYGLALMGLISPLKDDQTVVKLEPIIFVIVGYYFGRLPGQQNEKTLRDAVSREVRQSQEARQKEDEAQMRESDQRGHVQALEQKLRSVGATLGSVAPEIPTDELAPVLSKGGGTTTEAALRHSVAAALRILAT